MRLLLVFAAGLVAACTQPPTPVECDGGYLAGWAVIIRGDEMLRGNCRVQGTDAVGQLIVYCPPPDSGQ